jgi:hypothetical protein
MKAGLPQPQSKLVIPANLTGEIAQGGHGDAESILSTDAKAGHTGDSFRAGERVKLNDNFLYCVRHQASSKFLEPTFPSGHPWLIF